MTLSRRSIEVLLDLVEIRISDMDVSDREDARDLHVLERCRAELRAIKAAAEASEDKATAEASEDLTRRARSARTVY